MGGGRERSTGAANPERLPASPATVLSFQNAYAARHRTLFSAHPLPRISTTNTRMDQCTRKQHFRMNITSSIESQYTGVVLV